MKKQIFLWISFLLQQHVTECSLQLEFQFHQFSNPSGLKYNHDCCEDSFFCSSSACDTVFTNICLGPGGSSENCPWSGYVLTPGSVGGNSIQFTNSIGSISNPFSFTVTSQMDAFQLYIEVMDYDLIGSDLIDEVYIQVPGSIGEVMSQSFTGTYGVATILLSYSVTCTQNYYGSDCSTYCVPSDSSIGHYTCNSVNGSKICLPGYQNPDTDCTEVACALVCTGEGGNCSESGVCECSQGWSGTDCSIAQCAESCHPEGGYCDHPGQCLCKPLWNGTNCDQFPCHPNCSAVGGTCANAGGCDCLPDYTGEYCETDLNPCAHLTPCQNGGTCSNGDPNQYSCVCPPGFTGMDCEKDIDECNMSPCANNATCIDQPGSYECLCVLGWTGLNCEIDIDDCFTQPCQNGGNCTDLINAYYCTCPVEYEGLNCELMFNACVPDPCENGGSCSNLITDYTCHCLPGLTAKNCGFFLSSDLMSITPSPSTVSSGADAIATPVIAGTVAAMLAIITVVVVLVIVAGAVLYIRKNNRKVYLISQDFNQCDSTKTVCSTDQQQCKTDSQHQKDISNTKMTTNKAYNAHIFCSDAQQQLQPEADSQHQESSGDTAMKPNLAYNTHICSGGQHHLQQDDLNYEEMTPHSACNVLNFQSDLPAQQDDVNDAHITSNPAYSVVWQKEHSPAGTKMMPRP